MNEKTCATGILTLEQMEMLLVSMQTENFQADRDRSAGDLAVGVAQQNTAGPAIATGSSHVEEQMCW